MTEPEKTVEDAPAMRPKLWFFKMFDQFSSSDVLSNYTRTYAWMANQLGHMALGLMTVFLFIWITETFETAHEAWRTFTAPGGGQALFDDAPNWIIPLGLLVVALVIHTRRRALRESGDLPPMTPKPLRWQVLLPAAVALSTLTMIDADLANFILLIVAVLVMLVVIPGICLMIQSATPHEDPETEREIRCARQVRLLSIVAFGGFALLLVARGGFEIEAETVAYADHRFAPMAVWMLFSVAVCLMKDVRFLLIVWIGAAISAFIATDGFYLGFRHNETLGLLEGFVAAGEGLPFDLLKGVACGEPFCANSFQRRFAGVLLAGMLLVVLFVTLRFGPFVPEMQDKLAMPGAQARRWQREGHGPTYLHGHELETRQDRRTVLMVGILGALYLVYVTWEGLEADWALAIGGAIMSMIVWFTKEFASDLPNVHTELTTATLARARKLFNLKNRMPKHSQIFAARTPKPMALAYFHDARWDSRTDGVFYFAGAWIAAGVVTESPVLTVTGAPGGWASGSEIVGILVFAAFFAFFGHNWILRQRAVDRLGTMRANRMAVFDARIEMWTAEAGQPCEAPERGAAPWDTIRSLRILYDFARGWPDTDNAPVEEERRAVEHYDIPSFRHLIIFGRHGFGKAPLGAAIVTEATLADLTPRPTPTLSTGSWFGLMELLDSVRTGRMVDAATLCEYGTRERKRRHYSAREITAHPTRDLYFAPLADPESPPPLADRLVTPEQGDEPAPFARAASLIAIDNFQFSLARRAMGGEQEALAELDNMFTALALHEETVAKRAEQRGGPPVIAPKQTVWMVRYTPKAVNADTDGADAEEEPEPAEILVFIEWLRGQLDRYSLPPEQRGTEPPAPGAIAYLRLSGAGSEI